MSRASAREGPSQRPAGGIPDYLDFAGVHFGYQADAHCRARVQPGAEVPRQAKRIKGPDGHSRHIQERLYSRAHSSLCELHRADIALGDIHGSIVGQRKGELVSR